MKRGLLVLMMALPTILMAQTIDMVTNAGFVNFTYDGDTKGTFESVSATIKIDPSDLSKSSVVGSVDVNTINTKSDMRDKHLKSKDFFDAGVYPKMTFTASDITQEGKEFKVKGMLTIKETTQEVTFTATNDGDNLRFKVAIYGTDYGVSVKNTRAKSRIQIEVVIPLGV